MKNIDFLKETCRQINKDLTGYSETKIILTEALLNTPLQELTMQVQTIIDELIINKNLKPFIYSVDLAEKKIVAFLLGDKDDQELGFEIVERCAQKVYLRWHFSNRLNH